MLIPAVFLLSTCRDEESHVQSSNEQVLRKYEQLIAVERAEKERLYQEIGERNRLMQQQQDAWAKQEKERADVATKEEAQRLQQEFELAQIREREEQFSLQQAEELMLARRELHERRMAAKIVLDKAVEIFPLLRHDQLEERGRLPVNKILIHQPGTRSR